MKLLGRPQCPKHRFSDWAMDNPVTKALAGNKQENQEFIQLMKSY